MHFSIAHTFIQARQLEEGPDRSSLGVWSISYNRVRFGWGRVAEELWPYFLQDDERREFHAPEPSGVDQVAKRHRIRSYVRMRSSMECRKVLRQNERCVSVFLKTHDYTNKFIIFANDVPGYLDAKGGFEITPQFVEAPRGIVFLPPAAMPRSSGRTPYPSSETSRARSHSSSRTPGARNGAITARAACPMSSSIGGWSKPGQLMSLTLKSRKGRECRN